LSRCLSAVPLQVVATVLMLKLLMSHRLVGVGTVMVMIMMIVLKGIGQLEMSRGLRILLASMIMTIMSLETLKNLEETSLNEMNINVKMIND